MLDKEYIRSSVSRWATPIFFVKNKYGMIILCIDYCELKKMTIKNRYPLPRINNLFDEVGGEKYSLN
jgi:hypothetical protein